MITIAKTNSQKYKEQCEWGHMMNQWAMQSNIPYIPQEGIKDDGGGVLPGGPTSTFTQVDRDRMNDFSDCWSVYYFVCVVSISAYMRHRRKKKSTPGALAVTRSYFAYWMCSLCVTPPPLNTWHNTLFRFHYNKLKKTPCLLLQYDRAIFFLFIRVWGSALLRRTRCCRG